MKNKLEPVVIDNPRNKNLAYKTRDYIILLLTLLIWVGMSAKVYLIVVEESVLVLGFMTTDIVKLIATGFFSTFFSFHCWASYKRYIYFLNQPAR